MWCTDPDAGGLTRDEIEAVGYEWRPFTDEVVRTGIDLDTTSGHRLDSRGEDFYFVGNPAMGLWSTAANLID